MIKSKLACGLCKPYKKWKRNNTKRSQEDNKEIKKEIFKSPGVL